MLTEKTLNIIKETAKEFGVTKVILFGSCLVKDEKDAGDIDLAIDGVNSVTSWKFQSQLSMKLIRDIDVVDIFDNPPIMIFVKRDGIVIYECENKTTNTLRVRSERNKTISVSQEEIDSVIKDSLIAESINKFSVDQIKNRIVYGNSFEVFPKLPDNFVDLLIVDPPYNMTKTFGEKIFKEMNISDYREFTIKWIEGIKHALKPTASIYVCCDWRSGMIIGDVLQNYFTIQNKITWQREKGRGALHNWKNGMEDIWFATVDKNNYTFNVDAVKIRRKVLAPYKVDGKPKDWIESKDGNFRDTYPSNFWDDISIPYWSMPENTDHPTQKPEKLLAKLILASSNKDDFIFDPFMGSGTTAVVAKKLERNFSGIECEKEYLALTQKRLLMADSNKQIQGYSDGIFWERNTSALQVVKK